VAVSLVPVVVMIRLSRDGAPEARRRVVEPGARLGT